MKTYIHDDPCHCKFWKGFVSPACFWKTRAKEKDDMSFELRGTRYLLGNDAQQFRNLTNKLSQIVSDAGYMEFIPSALAKTDVFCDKAGPEILDQMYHFKDKKDRAVCLVPEITAIVQSIYKESWAKTMPKPVKIFYLARCYRYERPQEGRYREFWQFGVENLGGTTTKEEMVSLLTKCLSDSGLKIDADFLLHDNVKRGLDYYVEDGFEAEVPVLGAQKQVAGGGRYDCGIGWAIGVDRLLLAMEKSK